MERYAGKYLTFSLGSEAYGIPIGQVKEIIGMMEIIPLPEAPDFVKGVINLRGGIVPIIDLRLKLGMEALMYHERMCIIVLGIGTGAQRHTGIVVDSVSDVVNILTEAIEPPPDYGTFGNGRLLSAIGKVKDKVFLLLQMNGSLFEREGSGRSYTEG